ncbi:MAG: HPP family protein [Thermodesulfobacteriota bacterium]
MQTIKAGDLMVPIAEYATVSEDVTLNEAVLALEKAQAHVEQGREKHRAVLVLDSRGHVTGKIDQWAVLWALEPRYKQIGDIRESSRYGFSPEFLRSMIDNFGLWQKPLENLCQKAAGINVREIMHSLSPLEFIQEDASLDQALHQMVMGRFASLLVKKGASVVGILRQSDVFHEICERMKACRL